MESKIIILLTLLLITSFIPFSQAHNNEISHRNIIIYEVSPYPYPKTNMEYVCIANPSSEKINLSGYFITDFEGKLLLKGTMKPHSKIYIAENSSSFLRFMGFDPNYTYSQIKVGRFSLANKGDEIALYKNSRIIDIVIYGNSNYKGAGWSGEPLKIKEGHILRRHSFEDTNTSNDWSNYHVIGQSDFKPAGFKAHIEIFPYPDKWSEVIRFISQANKYVLIESYTMDSIIFERTLEEKMKEGVKIKILLEGAPIGGIENSEKFIVQKLYLKGATIKFMFNKPSNGIYDRYTFLHSKFIIIDGKAVLISTENFGSSLSPCGNRGYGVIVRTYSFAHYMERIFYDDFKDVQDIETYNNSFENLSLDAENRLELRHSVFNSINLTASIEPVLAPDFSINSFKKFIDGQRDLKIEALYIDTKIWGEIKNKTSSALVQYRYKGENVKLFNGLEHYIPYLHAKLIIGDSSVLVGSMNLGISSMERNREISLIIKNSNASKYLTKIFNYDWKGEYKPIPLIQIYKEKYGIKLDMSKSIGKIKDYRVYVDGKKVYQGSNPVCHLTLSNGKHSLRVVLLDYWGNAVSVNKEIWVENESVFDIRILIFLIFFAFFLYEVWKHHG